MPYRCVKQGNKYIRQKKESNGKWVKDAEHDSEEKCKASIRAIGASKHVNKVKLDLSGYVGDYEFSSARVENLLLGTSAREAVDLFINSPGGSYPEALKIYDRLNLHKGKKRVRISPIAASAGAVVALLPDAEVVMPENGLLRHHMPMVTGGDPKNAEELKQSAEQLEAVEETLVSMVVARCGMAKEQARAFLNEDRWLNAQQAKELGFVDIIQPLSKLSAKAVITNLSMPEEIVACIETTNRRIDVMAVKDILTRLDIQHEEDSEADVLEEQLVNHVSTLVEDITKLKEEKEELKKQIPPPKHEFPERIVNILIKERNLDIDNLVSDGRITPAVAKGLKKQFANTETIVNKVDEDGNPLDGFDALISSLAENEKVVNLGGNRPVGELEKQGGVGNPLLDDAKRRAEAAK